MEADWCRIVFVLMGDFSFFKTYTQFALTFFTFLVYHTHTYNSSVTGKLSKELVGYQNVLQDALTDAF